MLTEQIQSDSSPSVASYHAARSNRAIPPARSPRTSSSGSGSGLFRVLLTAGCLAFGFLAVGVLSGCGQNDDDLVEPLIPEASLFPEENLPNAEAGPVQDRLARAAGQSEDTDPQAPPREGELRFALRVGERFPLQKTIDQTLIQQSALGPVTGKSRLSMLFAITVEVEEQGRRRLGVQYQRVRYEHDLPGDRIQYDSMNPPADVPDSLQPYHGLAGNSLSFWIGADNRLIELVEFPEFLKRCVRHAPRDRQAALLAQLVATQGDEGFANFVDESIGLLPYNAEASGRETAVKVGQQWQRERRIVRPQPMEIRTTYELTDLTDTLAHISVLGTIEPAATTQLSPIQLASAEHRLSLQSGFQTGSVVIDVTTGLPLSCRIERSMDMLVEMPGQPPFPQHKTILTTIDAFPPESSATPPGPVGPIGPQPLQLRSIPAR